jgi:putative cell wall-binding protein
MAVSRLAGSDRYETAARMTADLSPGQPVVYVASGANYPDALGGAALAGGRNAPLLLTKPTSLPPPVRAELDRLRPRKIVVLGGTSAVSDDVLRTLRQYTTGGTARSVERWSAPDRYALSARISHEFGSGHNTVYVAAGTNFPDALTGAALAGRDKAPILLVRPTSIPGAVADQLALLGARRIVVIGGPGAVSDHVLSELKQYAAADTYKVRRIGGPDRYAVAANVAREFEAEKYRGYVANGQDFPDALAAASAAARGGYPVVLTRPDRLSTPAIAALGHVRVRNLTIVGGQKAVTNPVETALGDLIIHPVQPIDPEPGP